MGGKCSTHGKRENFTENCCGKEWKKKLRGVDGTIILKWIIRGWDGMAWINLAQT